MNGRGEMHDVVRGVGRALFAAVLLMVGGVLNIIYGISAIGNSKFFVADTHYVFASLKSWGWITLIIGVAEILASVSLLRGGAFGRYFGIAAGALAALVALLEIPAYPLWSLAVFGLSLWIIYGLTAPGPDDRWAQPSSSSSPTLPQAPRPPA
jgi:hypothetical protein